MRTPILDAIPTRKRGSAPGSNLSRWNMTLPMQALAKRAAINLRRIRGRTLAVALLAALSATVFAQEVVVFRIVAKDGRLNPPNLDVPAGKRIKIEISNEGTTPIE